MNNPNHFESKIREKLDNNQVDYQESYWKAYNETYPLHWYQNIRFSWKSHAIFAYSLLLFALGYLWNSSVFKKSPEKSATNVTITDTVFLVKEITYKDTVYVYQTRDLVYSGGGNLTAATARFKSNKQPNESKTRSAAIANTSKINLNEDQSDSMEPNKPTIKPLATYEINAIAHKNKFLSTRAVAQESQSGSSRSLVSPEKKEVDLNTTAFNAIRGEDQESRLKNGGNSKLSQNYWEQDGKDFDAIHTAREEEIGGIASMSTEIHSPAKDSTNTKEIAHINIVNDFIEDSDSTEWEYPEIIKMNQKRGNWEWGLGLSILNFLPYEQGEVRYNWGIYGGIDLSARRDRWSMYASLLYGSNYVEIEEVADVDISVSHEFAGFKNLTNTPEEVRMITQTLAPQFELKYALIHASKFGMGISAGVMGILPLERLFIYDYSWQSQVRTRESQPGMDPFKWMPNAGFSFWYQPRHDWQIQWGAKLYPTRVNVAIYEANAVAPVAIQLGVLKYW
jgi:hypothetical protein